MPVGGEWPVVGGQSEDASGVEEHGVEPRRDSLAISRAVASQPTVAVNRLDFGAHEVL